MAEQLVIKTHFTGMGVRFLLQSQGHSFLSVPTHITVHDTATRPRQQNPSRTPDPSRLHIFTKQNHPIDIDIKVLWL